MIEVEKINGQKIFINPYLIKTIEETPDTVVILAEGDSILLKTKAKEIVREIKKFFQDIQKPLL